MSQMPSSVHTTNVTVDDEVKFGVFANAVRVVEEAGPDCFLDFMVYSVEQNEATVVARVRVRRDFLDGIRDTLSDAMIVLGDEEAAEPVAANSYRKAKGPVH